MIGKLVVVKGGINTCVGVVVDEYYEMIAVKMLHALNTSSIPHLGFNPEYYWTHKDNIIKKSSRPAKMKPQLNLEEQQPTTL